MLTSAVVEDNAVPGAYTEAARGCSYIVHTASPLAGVQTGDLVEQAMTGNKAILEAAEATPTVKRVVFTSSGTALQPFERYFRSHPDNQAVQSGRVHEVGTLTANSTVPLPPPTSKEDSPLFLPYHRSKIAANDIVRQYAVNHQSSSHFSIVNLMPGWVLGPNELVSTKADVWQSSNVVLLFLFHQNEMWRAFSNKSPDEVPMLPVTVHIDDVADAHVRALDVHEGKGQYRNFLLACESPTGPVLMDAVDIVRKEFPEAVADGRIPLTGTHGKVFIRGSSAYRR